MGDQLYSLGRGGDEVTNEKAARRLRLLHPSVARRMQLHNCANCALCRHCERGRGANCVGGGVPVQLRHLPWSRRPTTASLPTHFCRRLGGELSPALTDTPHLAQTPSSLFNSLRRCNIYYCLLVNGDGDRDRDGDGDGDCVMVRPQRVVVG